MNNTNSQTITKAPADAGEHLAKLQKIIAKKSFCTLATTSQAGFPHNAGVVYQAIDGSLWFHTMRSSRKGANVANNPKVAVCIPFRRMPVGPPYTISFQARAEVIDMDDPRAVKLIEAGRLDRLTGHGELDTADGCFVAVTPVRALHSFGPGASMLDLIRDPIGTGGRTVAIETAVTR